MQNRQKNYDAYIGKPRKIIANKLQLQVTQF